MVADFLGRSEWMDVEQTAKVGWMVLYIQGRYES